MKKYRFCSKQPDTKLLLSEGDSQKVGCDNGKVQIISHIPLFGLSTDFQEKSYCYSCSSKAVKIAENSW
jgi:hypothetical protein